MSSNIFLYSFLFQWNPDAADDIYFGKMSRKRCHLYRTEAKYFICLERCQKNPDDTYFWKYYNREMICTLYVRDRNLISIRNLPLVGNQPFSSFTFFIFVITCWWINEPTTRKLNSFLSQKSYDSLKKYYTWKPNEKKAHGKKNRRKRKTEQKTTKRRKLYGLNKSRKIEIKQEKKKDEFVIKLHIRSWD